MPFAYVLHFCNTFAAYASTMVVALYAAHLGADAVVIGLLIAVSALAPAVLGVHAGRLADRFGVRRPMLAGSAMMGAALMLAALAGGMPALYVAVVVLGAGFVFYMVAQQSLVGAISTKETRARNFTNQILVATVAHFVGPLVTGWLIERFGYAAAFQTLALASAAAAVLLLTRIAARTCPPVRPAAASQEAPSFKTLLRNRPLCSIAATSGLVLTCVDLFQFYAPLHAQAAGLGPREIGLVMSAYAGGALMVRIFIPQLISLLGTGERLLVFALLLTMLAYAVFPFAGGAWLLGTYAFLIGIGLGCAQPLSLMLTYDYAPPGRSGEGMGLRLMVSNAARLVLPLAFGPVSAALGLAAVFWSNVGIIAGGAVLTWRLPGMRGGDKAPLATDKPVADARV